VAGAAGDGAVQADRCVIGSRLALRKGGGWIRQTVLMVVTLLSARLGWNICG
jgi:hypothetical protein